MSDLVGNQIVGFLMTWLISFNKSLCLLFSGNAPLESAEEKEWPQRYLVDRIFMKEMFQA